MKPLEEEGLEHARTVNFSERVIRALLPKALPRVTSPALVEAITVFLVTGQWIRPIEPGRYWEDEINRRVSITMTRYCARQVLFGKGSVKTQTYALDAFNSAVVELEYYLTTHETT